jgi:hypothetical protein
MTKRRRRHQSKPKARTERRSHWLREQPVGIPVEYFADLCQGIERCVAWGCKDGNHSLAATVEWISFSDYSGHAADILAWLDLLGGCCDCAVRTKVYRRLRRLARDSEG